MQIIPFTNDMLPQAAELLAARHRRDRAALPLIPAEFEDPERAQAPLLAALKNPHASGVAAVEGERLVAYLIGDLLIDQTWGRSSWVREPGCAYDPSVNVELMRDLYAALAKPWVEWGVFTHHAIVPIRDQALIHAWFSLGFGLQKVQALLDLEALDPTLPDLPPGITIRKATPDDRHILADLSDVIWRYQVQTPDFGVQVPEDVAEIRQGWAELVDDEKITVWLAEADGAVLGIQGYWPAGTNADWVSIPQGSVTMSVAGTRPAARGRGIGSLITRWGLRQARAAGYRICETDWRSANLLASRFWPKMGFQPTAYRLARRVDERILWARGA